MVAIPVVACRAGDPGGMGMPLPGFGLRRWAMAKVYDRVMRDYEAWIAPRRRELLAGAYGTVLELGPGTGANFAYLPAGIRWIGLEPNRHMHPALSARAREHGVDAACRVAGAEGIEAEDASVDVVLSTLVLCSVPDPERTLAEIRRVLRPEGRFLFLEHVAAAPGSAVRRRQRLMRPIWRFCADGCTPDRETDDLIRSAGFARVDLEAFETPSSVTPAFVSPHVIGTARR